MPHSTRRINMLVKEVMTANLITIGPEASLHYAAKEMLLHNVGILPVCDGKRLCGVITDRDLAIRGGANGNDFARTRVSEIMTTHCVVCSEEDDLEKAVDLMEASSVRRVIVTSEKEKAHAIGILSVDDIGRKCPDVAVSGRAAMRLNKKREICTTAMPIHATAAKPA
jgi:CBS domain-containing protein